MQATAATLLATANEGKTQFRHGVTGTPALTMHIGVTRIRQYGPDDVTSLGHHRAYRYGPNTEKMVLSIIAFCKRNKGGREWVV